MELEDNLKKVTIYTDGACSGNPGPGGWGAILIYGENQKEISGGDPQTTNNKMELTATIKALSMLKSKCRVDLYTDSKYIIDGITKWIDGWKQKNWKKNTKNPVKNIELWQQLDEFNNYHHVNWLWVKGHSGDPMNDRADELARMGIGS